MHNLVALGKNMPVATSQGAGGPVRGFNGTKIEWASTLADDLRQRAIKPNQGQMAVLERMIQGHEANIRIIGCNKGMVKDLTKLTQSW